MHFIVQSSTLYLEYAKLRFDFFLPRHVSIQLVPRIVFFIPKQASYPLNISMAMSVCPSRDHILGHLQLMIKAGRELHYPHPCAHKLNWVHSKGQENSIATLLTLSTPCTYVPCDSNTATDIYACPMLKIQICDDDVCIRFRLKYVRY